jgi:hypothetical protein
MGISELRFDLAKRNKKGISFILASVILWVLICIVWLLPTDKTSLKNLLTFCCAMPLMPLAFFLSKIIKAEFSVKDNPLDKLGLLFSFNQILYLLIAIWAFAGVPDKMVMIIAVIFGAHLLPFSWLYNSKAYLVMSIIIPLVVIVLGWGLDGGISYLIPAFMVFAEVIFSVWLALENKKGVPNTKRYSQLGHN